MSPSLTYFQISSSIDPVLLLEWIFASVVLVVAVTLLYVFVLSKSPSPEGLTVAKVEFQQQQQQQTQSVQLVQSTTEVSSAISQAETSLRENNFNAAVEYSAQAVGESLKSLIAKSRGQIPQSMGINDLAYLAQSRAKSAPQFAEPTYRLGNLRLRAVQNQPITPEEASWAVSFAKWLVQACSSEQIRF
jgi:HEPN domain-containing protein